VTAIFSRLCELAIADGDVPEDGSGLDSVWTRDLESRRRDKDWKIAMNPNTEAEERIEGFPVEGSASSIPAGAAVIHYGDWPVGIVRPTHGQLAWEESKDDPEANAIEDDLLRDLEDELIDAGEEIERTIAPQPMATDGGTAVVNVDASDLSLFQAEVLATIVEEKRYGLGIKRELEDWYGKEVNHGRLYPNLDDLVEMGLVEKSDRDRRTNDYMATPAGRRVLRELNDFFDARLPDEQLIADGGVAVDSPDVDVDQEDNAFVFALMQIDDVSVSIEEGRYVVSITGLDRGTIDAGPVISLANKYGHGIEDVTGDFDDPEVIVEVAR
jgi:DNA-binding PadR family transcriptional regulator